MNVAEALATTTVPSLDLSRFVRVPTSISVAETVEIMADAGRSCACVLDGTTLVGIFTRRDVLMRVVGRPLVWSHPIADEMSAPVQTMSDTATASDGIAIMNQWWVRNVPVTDASGHLVGNLSYYAVVELMGGILRSRWTDAGDAPGIEHNLGFVDFTGLHLHPPVTVQEDDSVAAAIHHMRVRAIGSVLVVDARGHLTGILTEFDLLTKVGCGKLDIAETKVRDIMTSEPAAFGARAPIADAIEPMVTKEFSHIPILGESGAPVGVASFRDLAAYLETSIEVSA